MTLVALDSLIQAAKAGQLVSFPTDTVPALAAKPECADLIFQAKQRSQDKPLILMGATPEDLWTYCQGTDSELAIWQRVADQFWPGALTLVLPASDRVPRVMNPLDPTTLGMRVPNSAIALEILAQTGPLATTSANLSGQPPLLEGSEIDLAFPQAQILSPACCENQAPPSKLPSTVAKWTGKGWETLRQGSVQLLSSN
ncbi:L-threonylcarbamoyladenylate synthase [Desertifilum sp. FACHB-1129]|uniref:L-threonylcarbamoyladenylate synthase n=1 Tax=Desertifilum tharense IPPAS B-1220 TaxID=1781255 RepID=A0A1E5QEL4_9CYAN|nr:MULTISPECIES: L-threonylcarbamoyladenylate synthase [Desertifilum]MDA0212662.1 L-threonylcarbamoyladenylate synthase [Cyanobacteria bacterium FC1]MBD2313107.1 L-threonylcarbamoyladenylate synthase [Desertifilum sp. FACHB-1129]MBD2324087.1 L-threonylcarbamoyladenylate synthase [Desertifilum sp. FACHB-866]MBD2334022.1 L-threonylcarbamoyladenylate synthase [Desertifilum sp. FACHB-868]OEJ73110.1 hypothetical protein BH720_21410 [Desertifilum tharense IPPAS B-1220]